jgi:hypothetical protein
MYKYIYIYIYNASVTLTSNGVADLQRNSAIASKRARSNATS